MTSISYVDCLWLSGGEETYCGSDLSSILSLLRSVTTMSPQKPRPLPIVTTSLTSWYAASSCSSAEEPIS